MIIEQSLNAELGKRTKTTKRSLPSFACLDQDVRPSLRYFRRAVQLILKRETCAYSYIRRKSY